MSAIATTNPWQNKQRNRSQQQTPEANAVYWQPGQELKTRPYKIEGTIGQGGFGVTYKARHLGLNHQVVLKTPNAMLRFSPCG